MSIAAEPFESRSLSLHDALPIYPGDLAPVRKGLAVVQDEDSQLVALLATRAPVEGEDIRWLDLCAGPGGKAVMLRSEEYTSELQSRLHLVCRLLLEKKKPL